MPTCECGEPLTMEMERDSWLCAECQKEDAELAESTKAMITGHYLNDTAVLLGQLESRLRFLARNISPWDAMTNYRQYLASVRYSKAKSEECRSREGSEA